MKRVVFIIPGHKHSFHQFEYQQIGAYFQKIGIKPIYIQPNWKRTVISQNLEAFLAIYNQTEADEKFILGFSFGAVIAFLASTKVEFKLQILCSLSPYFKEDLPKIKKWWIRFIGKRRYADFYALESLKIVKEVKSPTVLLFGSEESHFVEERTQVVYSKLKVQKKLIVAHGTKHDLADKRYLEAIKELINSI